MRSAFPSSHINSSYLLIENVTGPTGVVTIELRNPKANALGSTLVSEVSGLFQDVQTSTASLYDT